jgi:transcriptional regulator with XRE-family HTH domain
MTAVRPKSKMAELGQVLRTLREQHRHTARACADFAGCSAKVYDQYEAGEAVPTNHHWSKLCMMNRALARYRPLWQEALAEQAALERAKPLTAKPFASLTIVPDPTPPPVLVVDHPPITPPAAPVTPMSAQAKASEAVRNLPKGWRLADNVREREDFARGLFRDDPEASTLTVAALQTEKFGVATHRGRLSLIKAEVLDELKAVKRAAKAVTQEPRMTTPAPAPAPTPAPAPAPAEPKPTLSVADSVAAATELLMESIPNLASFTLTVDEAGAASVSYRTREVKVVEVTGTLTLKGKQS